MSMYRIKPVSDLGFKGYIVEKKKSFLFWTWWSVITDLSYTSNPCWFWTKERAEKFVEELKEADNGNKN